MSETGTKEMLLGDYIVEQIMASGSDYSGMEARRRAEMLIEMATIFDLSYHHTIHISVPKSSLN